MFSSSPTPVTLENLPEFASRFAATLCAGDVVCLSGEMGAGKTAFCRHLVECLLGSHVANFSSPTFTVMNQYEALGSAWRINHIDLYRLDSFSDWESLDLQSEFSTPQTVTLIEWGEKFPELETVFSKTVSFEYDASDPETRLITVTQKST